MRVKPVTLMSYRNLTLQGASAIATTINYAVHIYDRNRMVMLSKNHGGIKNITRFLVAAGVMTAKQRRAAINMMPKINNPSLRG